MLKRFFVVVLSFLMSAPALAEETSTDLGIYLFATGIKGDARIRNVNTEVDLGFDDIVENFDMGYMGYIEHRRGPWSFIGDLAYLRLAADDSFATDGNLEVELDIEFEQTVLEGFAGYRVFEHEYDTKELGIDLFIGARHTILEVELSSEASAFGLSRPSSREKEEDWTDTVFAVRLQYGSARGWGSSFWLDVGDGSDSSSEQFMALASYRGNGNWQYFGGYRYLNLEFDTGSDGSGFGVDLDYTGPMFGAAYRM
ncbi:MAG: hypothetical protein GY896_24855 [Gammaproteobacteria bacterium]|nr:hypothetical protein [Gammaproteobacteria bacterium]